MLGIDFLNTVFFTMLNTDQWRRGISSYKGLFSFCSLSGIEEIDDRGIDLRLAAADSTYACSLLPPYVWLFSLLLHLLSLDDFGQQSGHSCVPVLPTWGFLASLSSGQGGIAGLGLASGWHAPVWYRRQRITLAHAHSGRSSNKLD